VGVRRAARIAPGLTSALIGAILSAAPATEAAARAKTRFDAIRDCERTASLQLRRNNPAFRRFTIDRSHVNSERSAERVGSVFVTTVLSGRATYEGAGGPRVTKFVCLHGGMHRRALFVYALPD
jgi:hypothetical protein